MPWLKERNTCPTCRHEMPQEETVGDAGPSTATDMDTGGAAAAARPGPGMAGDGDGDGGSVSGRAPTFGDMLGGIFQQLHAQQGQGPIGEQRRGPAAASFDDIFGQLLRQSRRQFEAANSIGAQREQMRQQMTGMQREAMRHMRLDHEPRQWDPRAPPGWAPMSEQQQEVDDAEDQLLQQALQASLQEEQDRYALIDRQAALDIGSLGVADLRALLVRHNVDHSHCIERAELEQLVLRTVPPASFEDDVIVPQQAAAETRTVTGGGAIGGATDESDDHMLQEALAMSLAEQTASQTTATSGNNGNGTVSSVEQLREARLARFGQ